MSVRANVIAGAIASMATVTAASAAPSLASVANQIEPPSAGVELSAAAKAQIQNRSVLQFAAMPTGGWKKRAFVREGGKPWLQSGMPSDQTIADVGPVDVLAAFDAFHLNSKS